MLDYGCPKKRKDGMLKKHDPKKRKKGKRGQPCLKKNKNGERDDTKERTNALRSKPYLYPSIHPFIRLHLLIEIAWLVFPWILSLTLQYMECKYALFLSYPELNKSFIYIVGKTESRYCPGEDSKRWVLQENHLGNFAIFSKNFKKNISRWIVDLRTSITLHTILTLNNPRRGVS